MMAFDFVNSESCCRLEMIQCNRRNFEQVELVRHDDASEAVAYSSAAKCQIRQPRIFRARFVS
jgi:hypothetical protein